MATKQDDGLFLLEVLVDKIIFAKSPCFTDKDFRTCVNIQATSMEPLEICDDDPGGCTAKSGGPFVKSFNNGKSCLFSMKESEISKSMSKFPIKVCVYKSLPCGCLPTKVVMGEATIDMTKEFVQARKKFLADPTSVSYQALKDSFRIIGSDGAEAGEVLMFLRISCFGKLIITKFQGTCGPPMLGGGSSIVDRSCNPHKDFQSKKDPCACGAARIGGGSTSGGKTSGGYRGGGYGVCPVAKDPYNSMPCEDPDDPCYCSGPKPEVKAPLVCRNTDQYCLHVPKGELLKFPWYQALSEEQKVILCHICNGMIQQNQNNIQEMSLTKFETICTDVFNPSSLIELPDVSDKMSNLTLTNISSSASVQNVESKAQKVVFDNTTCAITNSCSTLFGRKETTVYMTLYKDDNYRRSFGTQATASINKCLQARCETQCVPENVGMLTNYFNSVLSKNTRNKNTIRNTDVYFFGRKKNPNKTGMGSNIFKTKHKRSNTDVNLQAPKCAAFQTQSSNQSIAAQTKPKGSSVSTCTSKAVCIRETKCPAMGVTNGDMVATVSHIKIGPRELCPFTGNNPCLGPSCVAAMKNAESAAPVKVSTVSNPRRGVFELVIRRMTGAPLAKNELMLEWTPPQSRPSPCRRQSPVPCTIEPCRPSKFKLVLCQQSSCYKPNCKKTSCKNTYGQICCRALPRKKYCKLTSYEKPCPPRCPPSPCRSPCSPSPCCGQPCSSSPCLRPCPVSYKCRRRSRSQPRLKPHKKRISPCQNRSRTCPIVKCRSISGSCITPCSRRIYCSRICKPKRCKSVLSDFC